ncbi:MAG TPA: hypothetical protein VMZ92_05445, partial [Planctomycetota bacterium]|nr:hypothetical protein [Planctomycetota bacterium]
MTTDDPMRRKIGVLRGCLRRLLAVDGVGRLLTVSVAAGTAAVLLDFLLKLPGAVRLFLLAAALGVTGFVLVRGLLKPLLVRMSDEDLAVSVERRFPHLNDRLISTVEFTRGDEETSYFGSPAMVEEVVAETYETAGGLDFRGGLVTSGVHRTVLSGVLLTAGVVLALVFSTTARVGAKRLLMPLARIAWPQQTFIRNVRPGSVRVPRGEDLNVQVQFAGRPPSKAWIDTTVGAGALNTRRMTALKDGSFLTALGPAADNVTYRVRGGDAVSETYSVEALERIRIQDRKLTYTYRPYTRLEEKVSEGAGGTLRAPVGTRVAIRA